MRRTRWGLGPLGNIADIIPPAPDLGMSAEQTTQTAQPLDGPPVIYRSVAANRSWSLEYAGRSPFEMANLVQMARHPGPLYLLDPVTCQTNMLPPEVAEPGMVLRRNGEDVQGWRPVGGEEQARVLAGGTAYETSIIAGGNFEDHSAWTERLGGLPRDELAHEWGITLRQANSGEQSLRVGFLAAGDAWHALHEMADAPISRRVRVSVWIRSGGGGMAPAPETAVSVYMRLRDPQTEAVTMREVIPPRQVGHQPWFTHTTGTVEIPAGFDGYQTVVAFSRHAARGHAFVDDLSVIEEHTAMGLVATYSALTTSAEAVSDRVPVRAGAWYTVSIQVGGRATVRLYSYGESDESVAESSGGDGWLTCTGQMPDGAREAAVAVLPEDGLAAFAQVQLTETEHHMPWHPGVGVPAVALTEGYEHTITRIGRDGQMRGEYSFTLTEVVRP